MVYVLVRPGRFASGQERVEREVIVSSIFDRLRGLHDGQFANLMGSKVCPIEGDLTKDRLGMSEQQYAEVAGNVTCIINSAAACEFGEQLDRALHVNTLGPGRMLQLAKDAGNIPVSHVSTCYVNGIRGGEIAEEVMPYGHTVATFKNSMPPVFDVDSEIASMLEQCASIRAKVAAGDRDDEVFAGFARSTLTNDRIVRDRQQFANNAVAHLGKQISRKHGWVDPYPFSKSLGEQLLVRDRGDVPLAIVRPAIIESTFTEPVPGWIEGLRMGNPLIVAMGKGKLPDFGGREENILDLVPCDMVTNTVLAAVPPRGALTGATSIKSPAVHGIRLPTANSTPLHTRRSTSIPCTSAAGSRFCRNPSKSFPSKNSSASWSGRGEPSSCCGSCARA